MQTEQSDAILTRKEDNFPKRELNDIQQDLDTIDKQKIADEILDWLIVNVENYIDNSQKTFKLNLIVDTDLTLKETKRMQDMYKSMPDIPEKEAQISECRDKFIKITKDILEIMCNNKDKKEQLFKRLVFYYEVEGIYKGVPLIQEKEGVVEILNFDYEPFDVKVDIKDKITGQVVNSYVIPEGFTIWFELALTPKKKMTSLF